METADHGLKVISPADDWCGAPIDWPRCPVCEEILGQAVYLEILSQKDGGSFRVACQKHDEAHNSNIGRWYSIEGLRGAGFVLAHVGRKTWADPHNILDAMWPWLRLTAR